MSRITVTVTRNANPDIVKMFMDSAARLSSHKDYCHPIVRVEE